MSRPRVQRRFEAATIEPQRSTGLRADNAAVIEGRTIFPSQVLGTWESQRFLISGANNTKLGKVVTKGPRAGWPIYQVSLEERATCPRSCPVFTGCYGNTMPYARRHRVDDDFLAALKAEVVTTARSHPNGLLVRLHGLGDFYSVGYVQAWAALIRMLPQLHVFGYTARRPDADDEESRAIARAVFDLTVENWKQFAIRLSRPGPGHQHAIVVDAAPTGPDIIVCPAQTGATEACASCGLCWADAARDKTIAFLRHGMKARGAGRKKTA